MPRDLPPHVESWRDRHGKRRHYFRRGRGRRIPLPDDPRSPEFATAYAEALAGIPGEPAGGRRKAVQGSLDALVSSYMKSTAFRQLRATTRRGYLSRLNLIRTAHGHRPVAGLTRERIDRGILAPYADRPGQALAILKMLRVLIRHAIAIGALKHDPSLGIKRPKTREIRAWTDAELQRFRDHWPIGSKPRLAFALTLYTAQRRSDVHRMTWADIQGDTIHVVQQKTEARLALFLHRDLQEVLRATPRRHVTILNTEFGRPYTVAGFSRFMREAITAARLPMACKVHGLRKTAGRMLAEAGASARQIMDVLGHKSLSEAERYTRDAEQARLARDAIQKLQGRNRNKSAQTAAHRFGETSKK